MAAMRGSPYQVIVCDLFNLHDPDHEIVVRGFPRRELAVEYARRRTWSSVDEMRAPGLSPEQVRGRWLALGEDCRVVGPEGVVYVARSELEFFLTNPIPPARRDWAGLYRSLLPDDFALTYDWASAPYPPPHHYEYLIVIGPGDRGRITFRPDYAGEGVLEWEETFHPALEARILLFNLLKALAVFDAPPAPPVEPAIGGEQAILDVHASGQDIHLALSLLPEREREEVHRAVRAVVPERVWETFEARRNARLAPRDTKEGGDL